MILEVLDRTNYDITSIRIVRWLRNHRDIGDHSPCPRTHICRFAIQGLQVLKVVGMCNRQHSATRAGYFQVQKKLQTAMPCDARRWAMLLRLGPQFLAVLFPCFFLKRHLPFQEERIQGLTWSQDCQRWDGVPKSQVMDFASMSNFYWREGLRCKKRLPHSLLLMAYTAQHWWQKVWFESSILMILRSTKHIQNGYYTKIY